VVRFGGEAEECSGLGGVVGEGGGGECAEAGFALAEYVVHWWRVVIVGDCYVWGQGEAFWIWIWRSFGLDLALFSL